MIWVELFNINWDWTVVLCSISTNQRERKRERATSSLDWVLSDHVILQSLLQHQASPHSSADAWITLLMWRKCNDNRSVLPFIAAMCNKIMTFLRSCTRSSSCTGHQLFPRINRVMLTIRPRFTLHTQSQTQTDAFKLENLNAFYMSIISNSHSMITFTSGIFPREVALCSGPVPSWYRCRREREHGKEKSLQQAETRKKCSVPFFLNNISFITGKTPRLHDLFNSAGLRILVMKCDESGAPRVRNNQTWSTLTGRSSPALVLICSMPQITS